LFVRVRKEWLQVARKSVAVFSATGCRACENTVLDIHYQVSSLSRWAQFSFWPHVLGSRWEDLDGQEDVDVCFFAGAIVTKDDEVAALKLREKSRILVGCGACAALGGMPGLANLRSGNERPLSNSSFQNEAPSLPRTRERVAALSQIVKVDYAVPGCPPPQNYLWTTLQSLVCGSESLARISFAASRLPQPIARAVMAGVLPPKGSIFAGERAVCASCSRRKDEKRFESFKRPYQIEADPDRCLLEQGLICQGVATQEGCGGLCTGAGVPCRGCFGKAAAIYDAGAKMVSAISSTFDSTEAEEMERIAEGFLDLPGTIYRYTLPSQCALLRVADGDSGVARSQARDPQQELPVENTCNS
jgi:F420-non-reducing hydrogenase small subunit